MSETQPAKSPPIQIAHSLEEIFLELPIMASRDNVLFPNTFIPVTVTDKESIELVDDILSRDKIFGYVAVKEEEGKWGGEVRAYDLYEYGTRAEVMKMLKLPDGSMRIMVQGLDRIKLKSIIQYQPYLKARVRVLADDYEKTPETEALIRTATNQFMAMVKLTPYMPAEELQVIITNLPNPLLLPYLIASNMNLSVGEKQKILELPTLRERLDRLVRLMAREIDILQTGKRIQAEVQEEIHKAQREHILREQMRIIQRELGEDDEASREIMMLRARLDEARLPAEASKVAEEELNRLRRISPASAEYNVVRTYLDWLIALPWSVTSEDNLDIKRAQAVLDEDHYGLEKPKERILEYLAVRKLKQDMRGPILCFVGPPGTGKTSLGKSIARALGRKFFRMSLGGIKDESEIRGHRRTYVGALPGRILQGMRTVGSNNPVFMLDEVDKIGMDFRGDPASALLEVLDPEQNFSFSDHYIEVPFNLSKVMFIATANILDTIPPALRDRMEVLELPGYTEDEKIKIAQIHLFPKQLREHGLSPNEFTIEEKTYHRIITEYTREAGVRNLEREIATICRKIARNKASGERLPKKIDAGDLEAYLGQPRYFSEVAERTSVPGVATGLAWTPYGGDILFIESTLMKGNKNLALTGHLGEVMKESAEAALSYIRSHAEALKIKADFFDNADIHIHVPAGAIPKDGPSAGLTMAVSLISLLTNRPVRPDVAMTGEITLRGKVLPVGGLKEKILAAHLAGIKTVVLPKRNEKDIKEITPATIRGLKFEFVDTIGEALQKVF